MSVDVIDNWEEFSKYYELILFELYGSDLLG